MTVTRRPISFLATTNPDTAAAFYGGVLGLIPVETSPYALVFQDGDTMLRVQIVGQLMPAAHTVHGWQVVDIAKEVAELGRKGVAMQRFAPLDQDGAGIWTTPDGHRIAWFSDPCGNILSLTQFAPETSDILDA